MDRVKRYQHAIQYVTININFFPVWFVYLSFIFKFETKTNLFYVILFFFLLYILWLLVLLFLWFQMAEQRFNKHQFSTVTFLVGMYQTQTTCKAVRKLLILILWIFYRTVANLFVFFFFLLYLYLSFVSCIFNVAIKRLKQCSVLHQSLIVMFQNGWLQV